LAGIGWNAGNSTDANSAAHRTDGCDSSSGFDINFGSDVNFGFICGPHGCSSAVDIIGSRRHEAGETGHRGRGDRRRIAAVGMNPTTDPNNNAGG